MTKLSLKSKIIVSVCFFALTIGSSLIYFVFSGAKNEMVKITQEANMSASIELARSVSDVLQDSTNYVKAIAIRVSSTKYLDKKPNSQLKELLNIVDSYGEDHPEYLATYILDQNGICIVSTDRRFVGQDYSFREYYKKGIQGTSYSEAVLGKTSNELGYYFSYPIRLTDSSFGGVAVAKLEPQHLEERLKSSQLATKGSLMFTDNYGVVLYSQKSDRVLRSLGQLNTPEHTRIQAEQRYLDTKIEPLQYSKAQEEIRKYKKPTFTEFYDIPDKETEVIGVTKVSQYPYFLITEVSINDLVASAVRIATILGIGVLTAVLAAVAAIVWIMNRFLKPLKAINEYAHKISEGDFEHIVHITSGDELQVLGETLNIMTIRLKGLYTNLENIIKEQTNELTVEVNQLEDAHNQTKALLTEVESKRLLLARQAQDLEKYQLAVENVSDHIVITDADGIILYANRAVEKITGFAREEIIGKKAGVQWGKLMSNELYEELWAQIKQNKKSFIGEFTNKRKNGEKYIAEAKVSPILDSKGNVIFFVGIERDITKMREVDRMKSEFISLASHQLRTPLSAMKWFLEMLMAGDIGKLTPEQKEIINNINDSNERMIELVNTLLDVSRIESGKLIIDPKPTDLRMLLNGLLSELEPQLKKNNQVITVDLPQGLQDVLLDPKLIRQVYMNYLTNAIKYSPQDTTITLKITLTKTEIISEVKNEGRGIALSEQDRIFQKFFRASNTGKQDTDGNGLGLYLVKSIVESSGGKVWFESVEGKGASFFFSIPFVTE